MIRVDRNDIPELVQHWCYGSALNFEITLFNGKSYMLDQWDVREESCRGYKKWDSITDQMAIDHFVEKHLHWFI